MTGSVPAHLNVPHQGRGCAHTPGPPSRRLASGRPSSWEAERRRKDRRTGGWEEGGQEEGGGSEAGSGEEEEEEGPGVREGLAETP